METHNEAFSKEVLQNEMFDEYDKNIIRQHLSNFYIVFQLGWDAAVKETIHVAQEIDKKIDKEVCVHPYDMLQFGQLTTSCGVCDKVLEDVTE